jgi:3-hydroxyisobutyrate dehydrogenase
MGIGFIGLENVGAKLAGSLVKNGFDVAVRDVGESAAQPSLEAEASCCDEKWPFAI